MGVSQLLKELRPCLIESHVEKYRGKTIAIDGNAFIFRGSYSCSEQVATGQSCSGPVDYVLKRINMLRHYGVIPWVVLDGRRTPMKEETNKTRKAEREKNLRMALDLKQQADRTSGKDKESLLEKAQTFFQKSIYVTRQMVTNTVEALKKAGVTCTVAPYEADAQVAFLVKCDLASAVITEDSDILVYMAAVKSTAPVLYKMDSFGACKELAFDPSKLSSLPGTIGKFGRGLSAFVGNGGGRLFVQLAILAGCDYVDNVKGLGLLTALPIITKFKCVSADRRVMQILLHLHRKGKIIPEGHRDRMHRAELSFFWHRVFDPRSEKCVHFCSVIPELVDTMEVPALSLSPGGDKFLGEHIDDTMIGNLARGNVDPITGVPVVAEPASSLAGGLRRSKSQTISFQGRSLAGPTRSFSAPVTTPGPKLSQQSRGSEPQKASQAPLRHHKRPAPVIGARETRTPQKGGARPLEDMFARAMFKTREKQGTAIDQKDLQDVSDIVLACGSVQHMLGRADEEEATSSPIAPVLLNPFRKKAPENGVTSPVICLTPTAVNPADEVPPSRNLEGADVWSRLGQSLDSSNQSGVGVIAKPETAGHKENIYHRAEEGMQNQQSHDATVATKRSISSAKGAEMSSTSVRSAKRRKQGSVGGKGATMLSFFSRAATPKR